MDWKSVLTKLAPTVLSATLGPLGPVANIALGAILGIDNADEKAIAEVIAQKGLTPEQITEIKRLELKYKDDEKERGFKYAELEFKDRDSARNASVAGGTAKQMLALSCVLLTLTLGSELAVLAFGSPVGTSELVVGRVLGLMDAVALTILTYHYGTSQSSALKTELLNSRSSS